MSLLRLFSRRFQRVDSPQKIRAQRVPLQMAQINTSIQLNDTEKQICDLLDACASHLLAEKGISTSCRIAGGWVRDKVCRMVFVKGFDNICFSYWGLRATT